MSDTERLNLIEHYKWQISLSANGKVWWIFGSFSTNKKGVKGKTLREAIDAALAAQMKWALS